MRCFSKNKQTKVNEKYVDVFAAIEREHRIEFKNRMYHIVHNVPQMKNNVEADRLLKSGRRLARKRQWTVAAERFNLSLCLAENGSPNEKLAYAERAECFANRNLYEKAAIDARLAKISEPPFKIRKRDKQTRLIEDLEPKLSFETHNLFKSMANVLEIKENDKYGRHVIAKCDIDIGQTIVVAKKFATAAYAHKPKQAYCLTCQKTDTNFIACAQCASVMFCSQKCQKTNDVHKMECKTIFHQITSSKVKLAMQLVLNAIKHFPNADAFIKFVESALDSSNDINRLAIGPTQSYGLLLRLHAHKSGDIHWCYQAFEILMTIPIIEDWFYTVEKSNFLKQLLVHHLAIIQSNGFNEFSGIKDGLDMSYIYDTISLFNHSCAPNAFYSVKDNVGFLMTVRPIKSGDQIFINYLGDLATEPKLKRLQFLSDNWGFQCECERCRPIHRMSIRAYDKILKEDDTFDYIISHSDDHKLPFGCQQRIRLTEECIKFMSAYGQNWSNSLDHVINCFILSSTRN